MSQQKPSTQPPFVAHWSEAVQAVGPVLLGVQVPALHQAVGAQSVSVVQAVVQAPEEQEPGAQGVPVGAVVQVPAPSQVCGVEALATQVVPQAVPEMYF
ncbi:MAG TPA: hypothetical protein VGI39_41210 [Polyangiaceae bacterium]